jgi:transposase
VRPEYDGSHQTFPGLDRKALGIDDLYRSQKDAVWMQVINGGGIADHEVGAGKTLIMCCGAMEMKRLGLTNKPMIIAMKANVHEIAQTFCTAYPDAKILYPGREDFTPVNRARIFNEMKNNNWDAVILTHEQFGMIPQSPEIQRDILQKELDSVEENLEVLRRQGREVSSYMLKGCQKRQVNLEARLKGITHQIATRKDDAVDFRLMGVDHLFVDESHKFKNLTFTTRHDRVAGLGNSEGSQRALNMLFAVRTIQDRTGKDLGATFLSGTTISNSLTELYLLFKYLRPKELERQGINTFDASACVKTIFDFFVIHIQKICIFVSVIQKDMSFIKSISREQLMMPSSLDDYVSSNHIVRFIDAFVDKVLKANPELISSKGKSNEGRPGYSPNSLCKLLIYGYFNSTSSSRKLEKETHRNLEAIWLMNNLRPDHWTISDFRKENRELIKRITIDFRRFLKDCDYIQGKSISGDGTKIKAYASRDSLSMKQIEKKLSNIEKEIELYLTQLATHDSIENEQEGLLQTSEELKSQIAVLQDQLSALQSQKDRLEAAAVEWLSATDPDARLMKSKGSFIPAYNIQNTVDNASHFITSCEVTNYQNDYYSLEANADTVKEQLDIVPETYIADGGYANEEQIQALEEQGIECIVPFQNESTNKKIAEENGICFTYDQKSDSFQCSQGKVLLLIQKNQKKRQHLYNKYQCKQCDECQKKPYCTKSKQGRIIYRRIDGEWLNEYKKKLTTNEFKEKFKLRKCVVEHPFATMKYLMGQIPILLRGIEKVQIEMDLYSTAYNLIRLKNIETVSLLLKKLENWNPVLGFCKSMDGFFCFLSYGGMKKMRIAYAVGN